MKKAILAVIISGFVLVSYYLYSQNPGERTVIPAPAVKETEDNSLKYSNDCKAVFISEMTEGPYYKSDTPERNKIAEQGTPGEKLLISGKVYDGFCNPISNARLDFWQADGDGNYDNTGYNLRGHQFTDGEGNYSLETVMPKEYEGRTAHIHLKIRANEKSKVYTSQLYFPGISRNNTDPIFDEKQTVDLNADKNQAKFDFYIPGE